MSEQSLGRTPWLSKISPWVAQPLTDAAKDAKVRSVLSLHAERVIYGRSAIITGWTMGGFGAAMMGISIWGWVMVLPLKTIQNEIWVADASTGIIAKPLTLEDAPKKFGTATEEHYLLQYLQARERWIPEMDRQNDHIAKIMSSPEEQARINEGRLRQEHNAVAIGKAGHVEIENVHYFPQATDKDSDTRRYLIRFQRTVWRGSNKESSEPWTNTTDFQWHPERAMTPADRADNPGGFVAISFTSNSDFKDPVRRK